MTQSLPTALGPLFVWWIQLWNYWLRSLLSYKNLWFSCWLMICRIIWRSRWLRAWVATLFSLLCPTWSVSLIMGTLWSPLLWKIIRIPCWSPKISWHTISFMLSKWLWKILKGWLRVLVGIIFTSVWLMWKMPCLSTISPKFISNLTGRWSLQDRTLPLKRCPIYSLTPIPSLLIWKRIILTNYSTPLWFLAGFSTRCSVQLIRIPWLS